MLAGRREGRREDHKENERTVEYRKCGREDSSFRYPGGHLNTAEEAWVKGSLWLQAHDNVNIRTHGYYLTTGNAPIVPHLRSAMQSVWQLNKIF